MAIRAMMRFALQQVTRTYTRLAFEVERVLWWLLVVPVTVDVRSELKLHYSMYSTLLSSGLVKYSTLQGNISYFTQ